MITDIEDYFAKGCGRCERFDTAACSTRLWAEGLAELRRMCRGAGLQEVVKWGHPCYMHAGRNVVIIGAFRGDFRLTFFDAGLMTDPAGVLEKQGPNTATPGMMRFVLNGDVVARAAIIRAYLHEAMGYAAAGVKAPKVQSETQWPEEMIEALDCDADLAEAFHGLTPGRQKSYAIALASAKASATRTARIAKFRDRILAGKGATER